MILSEIVCDLNEPDTRADEDIHVFGVWLHGGDCLDRTRSRADNGYTVLSPLFFLVFLVPTRCMHDSAFEGVQSGDVGHFEIVENASGMEEEIAFFVEVAG